jgi:hypothetical protein
VEAVTVKAAAERSAAKSCPSVKCRSSAERAAAKPAASVEGAAAMKSSTAVETTSTMEAAASAMGSTAALGECRRRRTKNYERNNRNENYRQDLLHFSPSNPTTRDYLAGTSFRRGHLRWQPTYRPILHPRRASRETATSR